MTEDEQFYVAAFIQHLVEVRDPNHAAAIADANHRMDWLDGPAAEFRITRITVLKPWHK